MARILLRRRRALNPLFTRGIVSLLYRSFRITVLACELNAQHPPNAFFVFGVHQTRLAKAPFPLGGFLCQNVASVALVAADFARARQPKPLGGST
jgi:hypothetical protein